MTLYETVTPFLREEDGRVTTIALVKLTTRQPVSKEAEKLEALREAITAWIRNSRAGRCCWNQSCGDLNIGDIICYEVSLRRWLKKPEQSELVLADIETLWHGETKGALGYDRHLFKE